MRVALSLALTKRSRSCSLLARSVGKARRLAPVREDAASCSAGLAGGHPEQPDRVPKARRAGCEPARSGCWGDNGPGARVYCPCLMISAYESKSGLGEPSSLSSPIVLSKSVPVGQS